MLEIVTLNFFFKFSQTPLPFNFIRMTVSIASNQWLGILTCFFSNINRLSLFSQLQLFSFTGTKKRNHSVKMTSVSGGCEFGCTFPQVRVPSLKSD